MFNIFTSKNMFLVKIKLAINDTCIEHFYNINEEDINLIKKLKYRQSNHVCPDEIRMYDPIRAELMQCMNRYCLFCSSKLIVAEYIDCHQVNDIFPIGSFKIKLGKNNFIIENDIDIQCLLSIVRQQEALENLEDKVKQEMLSRTDIVRVDNLKMNDLIIMNGRPCRVFSISRVLAPRGLYPQENNF